MTPMAKLTVAALALYAAATAQAQDTLQMPSREAFVVEQCVPAMRKQFGSDATAASFARASCECSYRLLADKDIVSREQFDAASTLCQLEFKHDPHAFVNKYDE